MAREGRNAELLKMELDDWAAACKKEVSLPGEAMPAALLLALVYRKQSDVDVKFTKSSQTLERSRTKGETTYLQATLTG